MSSGDNFENPFDITRTEYFNTRYNLIADYFEEPSFYENLIERERFIIVGSRGTGKSMILKSLYLPVFVESLKKKGVDPLKLKWKFIGIYVPCDNLDLQKYFNEGYSKYFAGGDSDKGVILWQRYLRNYFSLYIVREILHTLVTYGHDIGLNFAKAGEITKKILQDFDPSSIIKEEWPEKFEDLPAFFKKERKIFLDFIMEKISNPSKEFNRPIVDLSFIKDVCNVFINRLEKLMECRFYILLDDFFPPFVTFKQQANLLDLIRERGGPLSFKITTIPEGITYIAESGYEMRPGLDYSQEFLEYTNIGRGCEYWNFIKGITNRRLEKYKIDYSQLFEIPYVRFDIDSKFEEELRSKIISDDLKEALAKKGCYLSDEAKVTQTGKADWKIRDKKPEETTEYTIKKGKGGLTVSTPQTINDFLIRLRGEVSKGHNRPIYADFDMIVEMSSGVAGTYLLLAREMVNLVLRSKKETKFSDKCLPIPAEIQNKVVRDRSKWFLGTILSLEYGQPIYKLVSIMATKSRERLLKNSKATEYIQYKIKGYDTLLKGERDAHRKLIIAFRNNIIHSPESRPTDRQQNVILRTLILNRLLTHALRIPYRDRWSVDITADEIGKILLSDVSQPLQITEKPPISLAPQPIQMHMEERITSPIIKNSSCKVFSGHYCTKISELLQSEPGVFLALPFREDWHKITEKLIRDKVNNVTTSLDVSPNGDFTCKICEYIHKKDYGIYEISVLNDNVIFEMGLSIGLGKHTFAIWNKEEWAKTWGGKDSPTTFLISGFEGFPYFVTEDEISRIVRETQKSIEKNSWNKDEIVNVSNEEDKIFLALPIKSEYYKSFLKGQALKALEEIGIGKDKIINLPEDFKAGLTLIDTFRWILRSELCVIDSTQLPCYRDNIELLADYIWRMFSLGVAVGLRKPLIHCFNSNYTQEVASDIRGKCTFIYKDPALHDELLKATKEVYNHEKIR